MTVRVSDLDWPSHFIWPKVKGMKVGTCSSKSMMVDGPTHWLKVKRNKVRSCKRRDRSEHGHTRSLEVRRHRLSTCVEATMRYTGAFKDLHTMGAKLPEVKKYEGTYKGQTSMFLGQNRVKTKSMEVWPTFDI